MSHTGDEHTKDLDESHRLLLRKQRGGKKGSITKRINQIEEIMKENGSRTRIRSLFDSMLEVRKDAKDINQKLEDLGEDTENWMDDLDYQVDSIKAKMEEYIESRQADPPSEPGGSWLLGKFLQTDIEEDASKLQMRMNAVSIGQEHAPVVSSNSSTTIAPTPTVYTSAATTFSAGFNKPINTNTFRQRVDPTPFQLMNATKTKESNQVDSWIDQLDVAKPPHDPTVGKLDNSLATWFVQQGLPRIRIMVRRYPI